MQTVFFLRIFNTTFFLISTFTKWYTVYFQKRAIITFENACSEG